MQEFVSEKMTYETFEQFFHRYEQRLCRIAYSYLRDRDAARDAVNECFTAAWHNREYIEIKTFDHIYTSRSKTNALNIVATRNLKKQFTIKS